MSTESAPSVSNRMQNVLHRLQEKAGPYFESPHVVDRRTGNFLWLHNHFKTLDEKGVENFLKRESANVNDQTYFEDVLTSYLIHKVEHDKNKGVPKDKEFHLRVDQYEGIVALLEGKHLQAYTGYGKSKGVLPLASVVKAISTGGNIAVASVSPELVGELERQVTYLNGFLPDELRLSLYRCEQKQDKTESKVTLSSLTKHIVEGTRDTELEKEHFRRLFDPSKDSLYQFRSLSDPKEAEKPDTEWIAKRRKGASICLFNDDDLVFWKSATDREPEPEWTYFDEIHVPFERNNPYVTHDSGRLTKAGVEGYLFQRIVSGYAAEIMKQYQNEGDIHTKKGRYDFIDDAARLRAYETVRSMLTAGHAAHDPTLNAITNDVAEKLSVDSVKLKQWFRNYRKGVVRSIDLHGGKPVPTPEPHDKPGEWSYRGFMSWMKTDLAPFDKRADVLNDFIGGTYSSLLHAMAAKEGVTHTVEEGRVVSRDFMMGIGLPNREYEPHYGLALQTLRGTVQYINFNQTASTNITFEGFVADRLKGKVSGLSGTLKVPSLRSKRLRNSPLAEFLRKYTPGEIFVVPEKQEKYLPTPQYEKAFVEKTQKMAALVEKNKHRSSALFCFDEREGEQLADIMKTAFPDRTIFFVGGNMSEKQAQEMYDAFAETTDGILISTGRVGVGVDIKKKNNDFPDFLTVIDGLPFTTAQIYQILGRRRHTVRRPEDFHWFFSEDQAQVHPGFEYREDEEKTHLIRQLEAATGNRKTMLALVEEIVSRAEDQTSELVELKVAKDAYYRLAWQRYLENVLRDQASPKSLLGRWNGPEDERRKAVAEFFLTQGPRITLRQNLYRDIGVPSSLAAHLDRQAAFAGGDNLKSHFARYVEETKKMVDSRWNLFDWLRTRELELTEMLENATLFAEDEIKKKLPPQEDLVRLLESKRARFELYALNETKKPFTGRQPRPWTDADWQLGAQSLNASGNDYQLMVLFKDKGTDGQVYVRQPQRINVVNVPALTMDHVESRMQSWWPILRRYHSLLELNPGRADKGLSFHFLLHNGLSGQEFIDRYNRTQSAAGKRALIYRYLDLLKTFSITDQDVETAFPPELVDTLVAALDQHLGGATKHVSISETPTIDKEYPILHRGDRFIPFYCNPDTGRFYGLFIKAK